MSKQEISKNKRDTLHDIKAILFSEPNTDSDVISLNDLSKVIEYKKNEYKKMIDKNNDDFEYLLFSNFNGVSDVHFYCFDYYLDELILNVSGLSNSEKIYVTKENGKLKISNKESEFADEVMKVLGDEISCFYDKLYSYKPFFQTPKKTIKPVNSDFMVEVSNLYIKVYNFLNYNYIFDMYQSSNTYKINSNSNEVSNYVNGKEDIIFNKIFIKIDDCPVWSKPLLYELRQEQLNNNTCKDNKKLVKQILKKANNNQ